MPDFDASMIQFQGMQPADFPLLRATARRLERLDLAISTVAEAMASGSIRNVKLQEVKSTLSGAVERAWDQHVGTKFFGGDAWRAGLVTDGLRDLYYKISVYGLHDVHAAAKRVAATQETGPAIDAMRALMAELLPLAVAVTGLKDKVVMGRAPAPVKPPANPDQLRMTCGCCTRPIAVLGGTPTGRMAHHGYERPGEGWQTASCPGIGFMPLETTDDGPIYLKTSYEARLAKVRESLAKAPGLISLNVVISLRGVRSLKELTPADTEWPRAHAAHIAKLQHEISALRHGIEHVTKTIANWRPQTDAAKALLIERYGVIPERYQAPVSTAGAPAEADDTAAAIAADPPVATPFHEEDEPEDEAPSERMTG
ncbi:hypothetical protein [Variovorax gossypii]